MSWFAPWSSARRRIKRLRHRYTIAGTRIACSTCGKNQGRTVASRAALRGIGYEDGTLMVAKIQLLEPIAAAADERSPLRVLDRGYAILHGREAS